MCLELYTEQDCWILNYNLISATPVFLLKAWKDRRKSYLKYLLVCSTR